MIVAGIDTLNKAVSKLTSVRDQSEWQTVLLEITTSEVKTIDCSVGVKKSPLQLSLWIGTLASDFYRIVKSVIMIKYA